MTDHTHDLGPEGPLGDESSVRELLRSAGPRPAVPAADLDAIKAAARAQWQAQVAAGRAVPRIRWRETFAIAAAAVILLNVGALVWWKLLKPSASETAVVADVRFASGMTLRLLPGPGEEPRQMILREGEPVRVGDTFGTGPARASAPSRIAFQLASGPSLRLAAGSRLRVLGASAVELESGALYVDSDPERVAGEPVTVHTALGVVRHVGTQFEVRLEEGDGGESLRLRVREGVVEVERGEATHRAEQGVELTLAADGEVRRAEIPTRGEPWRWVLESAHAPSLEGRTPHSVYRWAARELGLELEYADGRAEGAAAGSRLSAAPISELDPEEVLEIALVASDMEREIVDGKLVIQLRR